MKAANASASAAATALPRSLPAAGVLPPARWPRPRFLLSSTMLQGLQPAPQTHSQHLSHAVGHPGPQLHWRLLPQPREQHAATHLLSQVQPEPSSLIHRCASRRPLCRTSTGAANAGGDGFQRRRRSDSQGGCPDAQDVRGLQGQRVAHTNARMTRSGLEQGKRLANESHVGVWAAPFSTKQCPSPPCSLTSRRRGLSSRTRRRMRMTGTMQPSRLPSGSTNDARK